LTREVDCIIEVHKASGAPGIVTDIEGTGHDPNGWHYAKVGVTPSATPGGTAVDFGGRFGPLNTVDSLRAYGAFEPYGRAGLLAELYCGQSDWCVRDGKFQRWDDIYPFMPWKRSALRNQHSNHIHVAVRPRTFLKPLSDIFPSPQEDDMPTPHSCIAPSGKGWWQLNPDGSVEARTFRPGDTIAFHGSMFDYPEERTKLNPKTNRPRVWTTIQAVGPLDQDGYYVFADDGFCGKLRKP
jgi:hypothetical protein